MLFDMTAGALNAVPKTTFAAEKVLERSHLQAAIRDNIGVLGEGLLVVAEEFGEFEDTHRRIDLLCVDRHARLVVVELKRTEDGGHMELQALRYAAMVSIMTFDELTATYARHLKSIGDPESDNDAARSKLIEWLDDTDTDEPVITREVGVILAAADFSQEITTTVLWLNEFYGMDITCIRLRPYRHDGRLLLDVQQVIPLPEAAALMVRLRKREAAVREAKSTDTRDLTKYVVRTPEGETEPLAKRRAILELAQGLHRHGASGEAIAQAVGAKKMMAVSGHAVGDALWEKFAEEYAQSEGRGRRWFTEAPFVDEDRTWLLSKMWGLQTEDALEGLVALSPDEFSFRAADED
jgi:Endonuclease NucS